MEHLTEMLRSAGIEGSRREAFWLVEAATGLSRAEIVSRRPAIESELVRRAEELGRRRCTGEPLQYVTGVAGFRSLELAVGPGVFIPRPETEIVAEQAIKRLPYSGTLIDVGTGSGAIALAIAQERSDARVIATDSSCDALGWARRNSERLALPIDLVECDLLDGLDRSLRGAVDVIVSNPPYVSDADKGTLPAEVVDYEPHSALFAGADGMEAIRRMARDARDWLTPGGWVVFETAGNRALPVAEELRSLGYEGVGIEQDLTGLDRIVEAHVRE